MEHEMTLIDLADELAISPDCLAVAGSTLICGEGNDLDVLALLPVAKVRKLEAFGFDHCTRYPYEGSPFTAFRRGTLNLLAITDRGFFLTELAAAKAAEWVQKQVNLFEDRETWVDFHGAIRDSLARYRNGTL